MISSVADFLSEFKEKALGRITEQDADIKHRPTIGNIYEGLTSNLLNKSLFKEMGLEIIQNSFVCNDRGSISHEIDCIITAKKGKKINFTNQYKCHIKDIIAVVQVKKNLFAKDIFESNINLASIDEISQEQIEVDISNGISDVPEHVYKLHEIAYTGITGKEYDRLNDTNSTYDERMLYHVLLKDDRAFFHRKCYWCRLIYHILYQ